MSTQCAVFIQPLKCYLQRNIATPLQHLTLTQNNGNMSKVHKKQSCERQIP